MNLGLGLNLTKIYKSGFSPADVPNLMQWLDASLSGSLVFNGSDISQWKDRSNNNNDVVQETEAKQPEYIADGLDDLPTLSFDGVNESMQLASYSQGDIQVMDVFMVMQFDDLTPDPKIFDSTNGDFRHAFARIEGGDVLSIFGVVLANFTQPGLAINTPYIYNPTFNTSDSAIRVTGDLLDSGFNVGTDSMRGITLGASYTQGNQFLNGRISEVIQYAGVVSDANRALITDYLHRKWNFHELVPPDIEGNVLWLDAADESSIILNGPNVSQWSDKSGLNNNFVQATSLDQPLYVPDGLNDKGIVLFDGISDNLRLNNKLLDETDTLTIIILFSTDDATKTQTIMEQNKLTALAKNHRLFFNEVGDKMGFVEEPSSGGPVHYNVFTPIIPEVYYTLEIIVESILTHSYIDGDNYTASVRQVYMGPDADIVSLGARWTGTAFSSSFFTGNIAEMMVYDRNLSESERSRLKIYLNKKWGL